MDNPFNSRLRPVPSRDSKPYWDGLKERRLLLQNAPIAALSAITRDRSAISAIR